jgi:hypothetical protein
VSIPEGGFPGMEKLDLKIITPDSPDGLAEHMIFELVQKPEQEDKTNE